MKNKLRIMKAMPSVTDDQIRSYMNFDAVLQQHRVHMEHRQNWLRGLKSLMTVSIIAGAAYLLLNQEEEPENLLQPENISPIGKTPVASEPTEVPPLENQKGSVTTNKKRKSGTTPPVQLQQTYTRAEPKAGYEYLYAYFNRELKYPGKAVKDSVQGTVVMSFIIDEEGNPARVTVEHSLGSLFDEECLRIITHMPDWNPAMLNGTPTLARISLPLTFRIGNKPISKSKVGPTYTGAEPKAGYDNLYNYFSSALKYPKDAIKDSVQGTAVISFTINERGRVAKVMFENSLGPLFDEECLRLISEMPEWKPARLNGDPVPAKISLPLTFKITSQSAVEK